MFHPGICGHCCFSTSYQCVMCLGERYCRVNSIFTEGMLIPLILLILKIYTFGFATILLAKF